MAVRITARARRGAWGASAAALLLALLCALPPEAAAQGAAALTAAAPVPAADLAPTGSLRVGVYPGSPTSMVRDRATGEIRGLSVELGEEVARRASVPVRRVEFPTVAEVVAAMAAGAVDFTVTNASPGRAGQVDFSAPLLALELGYLVPAGSGIADPAEVDRPGVRVGVTRGSSSERALPSLLKDARLAIVPTVRDVGAMFASGAIEAYATNKSILFEAAETIPGARVLPGRWGVEHIAVASPKGHEAARAWLGRFAAEARATGLVRRAADRAGLKGAVEE